VTKKKKIILWSAISGATFLLVLVLILVWTFQEAHLTRRLERVIAEHLNLDTTIGDVSFQLLPRPRVMVTDLILRVPNQADLPPFITMAHLSVDVGLLSALRHHVDTVHVDGLKIMVPPGKRRDAVAIPQNATGTKRDIVINHLISHDAELSFVGARKDHTPLTFLIQALTVNDLSFDQPMSFSASLTNPVPTGHIETQGTFGPWQKDDPGALPIAGDYTFTNADLNTINGIGGTLSSTGKYSGQLTRITATGTTETPDFSLDLGGKPLPLTTTFQAVVDGTDGSTRLVDVDAKMRNTRIRTKGLIANLDGPGRHAIDLDVRIDNGRVEDILALVMSTKKPTLTGDLSMQSTFSLPPGKTRVPQRLAMKGKFGLDRAKFTSQDVQAKLKELSRRSQGKEKDEDVGNVLTELNGAFVVKSGVLTMSDLTFLIPGAAVSVQGTYTLEDGRLDLIGTLQMEASVSRAVGGFKSIFLKPFDPLFRKNGGKTTVPIKITGTRDSPDIGLQVGKILKRGS
jgi:hypothetical protein